MLFWRTKLYNGILNIHWKWLNMKYNNMINSCHIRVVLLFLFSKFPIARLHNFYNKNCKLRKNLRLQNIVDFSKIFKQIRQERGHSTKMKMLGGEVWGRSCERQPFPSLPAALPLEMAISRNPLLCHQDSHQGGEDKGATAARLSTLCAWGNSKHFWNLHLIRFDGEEREVHTRRPKWPINSDLWEQSL